MDTTSVEPYYCIIGGIEIDITSVEPYYCIIGGIQIPRNGYHISGTILLHYWGNPNRALSLVTSFSIEKNLVDDHSFFEGIGEDYNSLIAEDYNSLIVSFSA